MPYIPTTTLHLHKPHVLHFPSLITYKNACLLLTIHIYIHIYVDSNGFPTCHQYSVN